MGYQIEYTSTARPRASRDNPFGRVCLMTAAFFLLFCLLCAVFSPESREVFFRLLFPGGGEATRQAAQVFVAELENGAPVAEALTNFCREVADAAGVH